MITEKLFVVEGIDGSGKTTQAKLLKERLQDQGHSVFLSKSCSANQKEVVEELIREFEIERQSIAMLFLYQALHEKQCRKALNALEQQDSIVIADRWNCSFWVYHLNFGPLKNRRDLLKILDRLAFKGRRPQTVFLLDVPVEKAMKRKEERKGQDKLDQESFETFALARKQYREMAAQRDNWSVIDGDRSISVIHEEIWEEIKDYI